ncbi:MAG: hypothetical protein HY894_07190 [Deltaproteobacteria bacterium]|nr:hypothetical protein [Deltaproteobacteria bacterium]
MTRSAYIGAAFAIAFLLALTGCASVDKNADAPEAGRIAGLRAEGVEAAVAGDAARSRAAFASALKSDRAIDNRGGEVVDLINLGRVSLALGDVEGAKGYSGEAVSLASALGDVKDLSEAYATLAKAEYASGGIDGAGSAIRHIDMALSLDKRDRAGDGAKMNVKGGALIAAGRAVEAEAVLNEALKSNLEGRDAMETGNSYRALAGTRVLGGRDGDALADYRKAYEYDRAIGAGAKIAADLRAIAALQMKAGQTAEAGFSLKRLYAVADAGNLTDEALFALDNLIKLREGGADAEDFYRKRRDELLKGMRK